MSHPRIEAALERALTLAAGHDCPPRLAAALRHGVFPGGGRVRPALTLAVARACGEDDAALTDACAAAVELMHCASLVHDDLPCFDDAAWRRGRPSVQHAFGEQMAVLVGDGLIVLAFELVARAPTTHPTRIARIVTALASGVGAPRGIVGGQAWECEPEVDVARYHRAKTGALFEAAAVLGAVAAGADPEPWRAVAALMGEAYQVADDLADALSDAGTLGKPVGQDAALQRPSATASLGIDGALARLEALSQAAVEAVPVCPGRAEVVRLIHHTVGRLLPGAHAAVG